MPSKKTKRSTARRKSETRLPYALKQRLAFIEESLFWSGEAFRGHLEKQFSISNQRAALDFAFYRKKHPGNVQYDGSAKRYVTTEQFCPFYYSATISTDLKTWAPVEDVPTFERSCDLDAIRTIVLSIRRKLRCRVFYRSVNSATAMWREISPHTFVHDGQRLHARLFDHTSNKWCDFVLGRIEKTELTTIPSASPAEDLLWHEKIVVRIRPSQQLSPVAQKALRADFKARNGIVPIETRAALKYYIEVVLGVKKWAGTRWVVVGKDVHY